jgi:hypothetical protein
MSTKQITVYAIGNDLFQIEGYEPPQKAAERIYAISEGITKPGHGYPFGGRMAIMEFIDTSPDMTFLVRETGKSDKELAASVDPEAEVTFYTFDSVQAKSDIGIPRQTTEPLIETLVREPGGKRTNIVAQETWVNFIAKNLPEAETQPALYVIPHHRMERVVVHGNNLATVKERLQDHAVQNMQWIMPYVDEAIADHEARMNAAPAPKL